MNPGPISASRAIDLSGLKAAAQAPAGASYIVSADESTFETLLSRSTQHPIVVEFTSPRANAQALSDDLAALAAEAAGRWLLVRVNIDRSPALARALGIQAVPMVVGAVSGQLLPLFQGTATKEDAAAAVARLLQVAVANGVTGRATPVPPAQDAAGSAGPGPRFAAADAALEEGNFEAAVAEFDKILAQTPGDSEASAGRAQARLLARLAAADPEAVLAKAKAASDDVDVQLAVADLEVGGGDPEAAFERLVALVTSTSGADRERVRVRLLELFEAIGASDPVVLRARRALTSALF